MMNQKRPIPEDFAARRAELVTWKALCQHYGCGEGVLLRWLKESGHKTNPIKATPAPSDLAAMAKQMHVSALMKHYSVSRGIVERWLHQANIEAAPVTKSMFGKRKAPPADIMRIAPTMTKKELRLHYRCGFEVIDRWLAETGAKPMSYVEWRALTPVKSPIKPHPKVHAVGLSANLATARIHTIHDIAADTLRRERFPVYRCDERGKQCVTGAFFRVGWSVLTPDELLAKAARYERKAA